MELILTEVCEYLNNYFWQKKITGAFTIEEGSIQIPALKEGQYFRIIGSTFNDGVHLYPATDLTDEEFEGAIWAMAVPSTVIAIASDIKEWQTLYGGADSSAMSPFNSESFGGYSYSKSGGYASNSSDDGEGTWQGVFKNRLKRWKKL